MLSLPPLSLYIHIPWCIKKCPYCDFNSHVLPKEMPEKVYIDQLLQDLAQENKNIQGRKFNSIFIGGGTPSLFSPSVFTYLIKQLRHINQNYGQIEITLEANPSTFEQQKFKEFYKAGINRLSIGIQSFQDEQLSQLGRIHNGKEARKAIDVALQAGFTNFNLDLMHGLPKQTPDNALSDIKTAIAFKPSHISWYQLTIEPNTVFYSKPPQLPNEKTLLEIQQKGKQLLELFGYKQYEISAYCQQGQESEHNLNYWRFGDYLGIGAGSHGKITSIENNNIFRNWKKKQPNNYIRSIDSKLAGTRDLMRSDLPIEFMMNGLRLLEGVTINQFESRTGLSKLELVKPLKEAKSLNLINFDGENIKPTEKGLLFLNDLIALF